MKKTAILAFCFLMLVTAYDTKAEGSGQVKVGYSLLDEEGNRSVNHNTFNQYEGFSLSLDRFNYRFDNGWYLKANLDRMTLNNRNMNLSLNNPRIFGVELFNNQYRRIYDFNGNDFTRRHRTGMSLWYAPHKAIRIFGGGQLTGKSGRTISFYDPGYVETPVKVDYNQNTYNVGLRYNYSGRMLQAEYKGSTFEDKENSDRDQTRGIFRIIGQMPVPKYDWIILSGGFQRFDTKYDNTDFSIGSNRVWGGAVINAPANFTINYNFIFDRTASDSDFVSTDNLAHTVYISHIWPNKAGLTVGYQNHVNDDFENAVNSDTYYLSGWLKPTSRINFRGEYGNRAEKVTDGYRLTGHEDRFRFKFSGMYHQINVGSIKIGIDGRKRKNESLASESNYTRICADGNLVLAKIGTISGGYSFQTGEYKNPEQNFEYNSHILNGDITFVEYKGAILNIGAVYYRTKKDLDVESFRLNFRIDYRLDNGYGIDLAYNVDNFDDFLFRDQYYTANIIEINLKKDISL